MNIYNGLPVWGNLCHPHIHKWIGWRCIQSGLLNVCLSGNAIIVGLWILTCQTKTKNNQINTSICCAGWQCTSILFWKYHRLNILSKSPVCTWYLPLGSVFSGMTQQSLASESWDVKQKQKTTRLLQVFVVHDDNVLQFHFYNVQYHLLNILSKSPVCTWYLPLGSVSLGWHSDLWPVNPEVSNKNKKQPDYYKYLLYRMTMYFNSFFTMHSIIYWTFWVSHLFAPDIFHLDLFLWGDAAIFGQWILRCQTKTKKTFLYSFIYLGHSN